MRRRAVEHGAIHLFRNRGAWRLQYCAQHLAQKGQLLIGRDEGFDVLKVHFGPDDDPCRQGEEVLDSLGLAGYTFLNKGLEKLRCRRAYVRIFLDLFKLQEIGESLINHMVKR